MITRTTTLGVSIFCFLLRTTPACSIKNYWAGSIVESSPGIEMAYVTTNTTYLPFLLHSINSADTRIKSVQCTGHTLEHCPHLHQNFTLMTMEVYPACYGTFNVPLGNISSRRSHWHCTRPLVSSICILVTQFFSHIQ